MFAQPTAWLPRQAIAHERIAPDLNRLLGDWGDQWFVSARAAAAPIIQDDWPAQNGSAPWRSIQPVAAIPFTSAAKATIAGAMLGVRIPHGPLTREDNIVVNALAVACADDVLRRIASLAGHASESLHIVDAPANIAAACWWDVSIGQGHRSFRLTITQAATVELVKRKLPPPIKPKVSARSFALGDQPVDLEAELGKCSISLAELQGLAIGDVVILDRPAADPVRLLVEGRRSMLAGSLALANGRSALTLTSGSKAYV